MIAKAGFVVGMLVIATLLETCGDAAVRHTQTLEGTLLRAGFFALGAVLLFGYGYFLTSVPIEFGRLFGIYIAVLFIVSQVVNFFAFRQAPSLATFAGGALIVAGGLVVTAWKPS